MQTRDQCLMILNEYTKSESLIKHALAVETCMRTYAKKYSQDEEYWGNIGLLHDFDYEMYPTEREHPFKGAEILEQRGFDGEFRRTILSHADYTGIPRDTLVSKVLFACDELSGFLIAAAYVRPNRNIDELETKSVIKKMKDKAFARAVSRDDIIKGAAALNITLEEHIGICLESLKSNKKSLGFSG